MKKKILLLQTEKNKLKSVKLVENTKKILKYPCKNILHKPGMIKFGKLPGKERHEYSRADSLQECGCE